MDKYTQGRPSSQVSCDQKYRQQMVEAQNLCLKELKAYGSAIRDSHRFLLPQIGGCP